MIGIVSTLKTLVRIWATCECDAIIHKVFTKRTRRARKSYGIVRRGRGPHAHTCAPVCKHVALRRRCARAQLPAPAPLRPASPLVFIHRSRRHPSAYGMLSRIPELTSNQIPLSRTTRQLIVYLGLYHRINGSRLYCWILCCAVGKLN